MKNVSHMNGKTMLCVSRITTGYGKKQVLTDVSFEVREREIVLLTGGNGSGKSTVLKTIYGLLEPWTHEGQIIFNGEDITALPTETMIQRGIVYMPQKRNVFEDFTVEENLLTSASIYSKAEAKQRIERTFDEFPSLAELRKRTPFNLSGGEKQLLAFANVFIHNACMFLLDEPFAGADESVTAKLAGMIISLQSRASFIVVEHKEQALAGANATEIELELGEVKK